ncbi:MAG: type I restriction enzyme HsdR N-terminal domain-containing protein [Bacteroidales bacterium]|nr:type I restriction enzyme HsdR N-terminal domain-containing protein [Bacteroidales bacterium]
MEKLNLPTYFFKIKSINQKKYIFDTIRKKYILLTPEEWVRQNFIQYLINEKKFPASLISVEMNLNINKQKQRSDIVLFDNNGKAIVIVECKAAIIKINQKVFDQVARYNIPLKVNYLIVTNGLNHYCCIIDYKTNSYKFLKEIPDYKDIK